MRKQMVVLLAGAMLMMGMATLANATVTESIDSNGALASATITPGSPITTGSYAGTLGDVSISITGTDVNTTTLGTFDVGTVALLGTGTVTVDLKDTGVTLATLPTNPNLAISGAFSASEHGTASIVSDVIEINGVIVPSLSASLTGTSSTTTAGTAYAPTTPFTVDEIVTVQLGDASSTESHASPSSSTQRRISTRGSGGGVFWSLARPLYRAGTLRALPRLSLRFPLTSMMLSGRLPRTREKSLDLTSSAL
jgi:hypothetical protein